MAKKAIISRHIIVFSSPTPIYGVILINSEIIQDVITLEQSRSIDSLLQQFKHYQIELLQDYYISPGLIDLGVRAQFEQLSTLTQMAVSGGTTLIALQNSIHAQSQQEPSVLYCDLSNIIRVDSKNIDTLESQIKDSTLAIKAYLYPPSWKISPTPLNYQHLVDISLNTELPLLIDANMPQPQELYKVSPFRHAPLQQRLHGQIDQALSLFGAAFPEVLNQQDEDSQEESFPDPRKFTRKATFNAKIPRLHPEEFLQRKKRTVSDEDILIKSPDQWNVQKKKGKRRTIYDDLKQRISNYQDSISNISRVQESSYTSAGRTLYVPQQNKSATLQLSPLSNSSEAQSPMSPFKRRIQSIRPSTLTLSPILTSTDSSYITHLTSSPSKWEVQGVTKILSLPGLQFCSIHFCNLSSVAAINNIWMYKQVNRGISCDTTANYLFFTDQSVKIAQTEFKQSPPIRNRANNSFLWEILKFKGIDCISSHHSSIPREYKRVDRGNFKRALSGVNCLGFTLQAVWSALVQSEKEQEVLERYLVRLAKWVSLKPASIVGIQEQRGSIQKDRYADLVIWSPYRAFVGISSSEFRETCVYQGRNLYGRIKRVYVRGECVFDEGDFCPAGRVYNRTYQL